MEESATEVSETATSDALPLRSFASAPADVYCHAEVRPRPTRIPAAAPRPTAFPVQGPSQGVPVQLTLSVLFLAAQPAQFF